MRGPRTPKLHLPSEVSQICRFTSQPYVRDVRQRRTSFTFYDLLGDPTRLSSTRTMTPSFALHVMVQSEDGPSPDGRVSYRLATGTSHKRRRIFGADDGIRTPGDKLDSHRLCGEWTVVRRGGHIQPRERRQVTHRLAERQSG
jgi:hypothetical protein